MKNKAQKALYDQLYRTANAGRLKQQQAVNYRANRSVVLERVAAWTAANPEKASQAKARYKRTPAGRVAEKRYKRARRATHRLARPRWRDQVAIDSIYEQSDRTGMHIDHIVPLRHPLVCGLHVENNLRLIPAVENQKKGNRWWPHCPDHLITPDGVRA